MKYWVKVKEVYARLRVSLWITQQDGPDWAPRERAKWVHYMRLYSASWQLIWRKAKVR